MIHSSWDWDSLVYHHFTSPEKASLGGWKPMTGLGVNLSGSGSSGSGVGIDIEDALPLLPQGAKYVGSSAKARGQVVKPVPAPRRVRVYREPASGGLGQIQIPVEAVTKEALAAHVGDVKRDAKLQVLGSFLLGIVVGYKIPKANPIAWGLTAGAIMLTGMSAGSLTKGSGPKDGEAR